MFCLATAFLLPSLCYKMHTLKKLLPERGSALQLATFFFFSFLLHLSGNGPSNDGFCRAGLKTAPCVLVHQPLCKSSGDVVARYGLGEAGRVTAAGVVWTRGCEDQPGAQMAYFTSPSRSPLPRWEDQAAFLWEEGPLQQHQSSLWLCKTAVKEESLTLSPGAFAPSHCLFSPRQRSQPGDFFPAAAAWKLPDHD